MKKRPVGLIILDGWGFRAEREHNAIALARTPFFDSLMERYPSTLIHASEERVGLPPGQMGNSEVGHLNIGAGRVVYQEIMRINRAMEKGEFSSNPVLRKAVGYAGERGSALHLIGLLSDGGVHSMNTHIYGLLEMAKAEGLKKVFVHPLLDGRDTPPSSGAGYLKELQGEMDRLGTGKIATVGGRYYGMDRDNRWDRTEKAYRAMVFGDGPEADDPARAVMRSYEKDVTDEFVEPVVIKNKGKPVGKIADGDSVIFFNFRADRARQLTRALAVPEFNRFDRGGFIDLIYVCMTLYDETFDLPVAFPHHSMDDILAEVFARNGIKNLRIAETEKYAHVTYFFNGGEEKVFDHEARVLVPSPSVPTYDLKPEMSAYEVADRAVSKIRSDGFDVVVLNFANTDMVGHTGVMEAAVSAVEAVDVNLEKVASCILGQGGILLVTADHGNAELMWDEKSGGPHTAHTLNPVPFIYADNDWKGELRDDGALEDIAPTILSILGLEIPDRMTGRDLRKS